MKMLAAFVSYVMSLVVGFVILFFGLGGLTITIIGFASGIFQGVIAGIACMFGSFLYVLIMNGLAMYADGAE